VGKLIPALGRERAEVKTWEALADGVMEAAVAARLEASWSGRREGERSQTWIARQHAKITAALGAMNTAIGDKPFCCGIHLSLADIATGSALGYLDFRFPDLAWRDEFPALARLDEKLAQRSSFADTRHS
jgi:glutathione S-transferase